ncbi:Ddx49 protein [Thecamonas trahens ATCC 50062]|uniref:Ddx49 protein n=1 Tax=Thecamonas trahens ATCC 50062 TaxID=461836 RepID=A0A0L0DBH7_THETB|nr:Ddx49 protein [Thecamonas trahens ATCC 50062]KNC49466.1 Ddx49 protein [Thecamonas trahens ATCC 50062]|eukprot:XP_013757885.1 Ddx49 protein [Thecamonas trahens ATCC 50062]
MHDEDDLWAGLGDELDKDLAEVTAVEEELVPEALEALFAGKSRVATAPGSEDGDKDVVEAAGGEGDGGDNEDPAEESGHVVETASFESLGVCKWLRSSMAGLGIEAPTPVQVATLPAALAGSDVIGSAPTGSGKTLAFALPILDALSRDLYGIFALVLTPTRELAMQIAEQFQVVGKPLGVRVTTVIGGLDMMTQARELASKPHVVIATPGRMADHVLSSGNVSLHKVKFLVLDEADRLLEPSFSTALSTIMDAVPGREQRQTLLFSATLTPTITDLMDNVLVDARVTQEYVFLPAKVKEVYMVHLLRQLAPQSAMVFVAKCWTAELLYEMLLLLGFRAVTLHASMTQPRRLAALGKFRARTADILVATDVAARGLDIPTVDLVVNFDICRNPADYVHRIGRTARAGRAGLALSLISQYDVKLIKRIEATTAIQLSEREVDEDAALMNINRVSTAMREAKLMLMRRNFQAVDDARKNAAYRSSSARARDAKSKNKNKSKSKDTGKGKSRAKGKDKGAPKRRRSHGSGSKSVSRKRKKHK